MKKLFLKTKNWALRHKFYATGILIILAIILYYSYRALFVAAAVPQYTLAAAHTGSITQTVTGSGQISSSNQVDVKSQVSGTIQSIKVSVGQHVAKGDLLTTIDPTSAAIDLANARIAYAKLTQPPKAADLSSATNNVNKSYNDGFNAVSSAFLDMPTALAGMKDLFYGQSGFLSDQRAGSLIQSARETRTKAAVSYDFVANQYIGVFEEYKGLTRASATSSIDQLIAHTYSLAKNVATALQNSQSTVTFIMSAQPDYYAKDASTASSNVNAWSSQINSDLTSILSGQNSIISSTNAFGTLVTGADTLDIQSQQLSLQQKQQSYDNYFIRAPFDGIVGRIPVNVYDQASGSSVIATIVGDQKISNISLNEVDAAKVQSGQTVNITFDAIDDFTATGTVSSVDQVGTVSNGVVSYVVKIIIGTSDARIKPGMSVNTSIITKQVDDVLIVASSAVKTSGKTHYVEVLPVNMDSSASSTSNRSSAYKMASTNNILNGTSTGSFTRSSGTRTNATRTTTLSSATTPTKIDVTVGDSDDSNTEIVEGLTRGQFVITKTIAVGTTQTTAPNILSSLGPQRGGGGAGRTPGTGGFRGN